MTLYIAWTLILYSHQTGYRETTVALTSIENIASQQECEKTLAEALKRWPDVVKSGMCISVKKVK